MSTAATTTPANNYRLQISIIGAFFFIFGFITWTNGTLIPYLKIACDLQEEWQAYLVTFAFYISYTLMAIPCGMILRKTGMVKGMQLGLAVMALGCLLFIPAASSRTYSFFLLGLFVIGAGLTILQTAVNPYITILGPANRAAQRISIMGICNKLAGMLAPIILGAIILQNSDGLTEELKQLTGTARDARLDELASKVITPYSVLAGALLLVSFLLRFASLPEIKTDNTLVAENTNTTQDSVWKHPNLMFGFAAVFCSVAVEVMAGDTIGRYGQYHGFSLDVAKSLTSYTLFSMIGGYIFGIVAIPKFISQENAFRVFNFIGIVLTLLVLFTPGATSVYCLAALGFANSMLWPAIWPAAMKGLPGKLINIGSAVLIMGIAGGAVMPLLYGILAGVQGFQTAYWLMLPCYFFNLYYWWKNMRK